MTNRRAGRMLSGCVVVAIAAGMVAADTPSSDRPPNVIYILADDLGYHEVGAYGQQKIRTPNLDRLADEGMRFTQHYSGSPVCAPSRCVLMTGKHTGHAAIRGNKESGGWGPEEPEGQWPLPADEVTIAELVNAHGYATGFVGKWGLGGPGSVGHPNNQGFDHFYGYLCQRVAHNFYPTHLWRNHDVDILHGNEHFSAHQRLEAPLDDEADYAKYAGAVYAPAEMIREAEGFIAAHAKEPFLLVYAPLIPHVALQVPQTAIDEYPREWDTVHYLGDKGYLPHPRPRAAYAAMITEMDRNIGRLLDALKQHGVSDDTVIMFSSDNGTTYAGGVDRAFFGSLGDLRGTKGTLFEGGIRVPMIAHWPGRISAGAVSAHPSAFCDVLPTVMELLGLPTPDGLDGISFAPTLLGALESGESEQDHHAVMYWEHPEGARWQAVILDGRWKGVRRNIREGNMAVEVFDLNTDPNETRNIALERPDLVERIAEAMRVERVSSAVFPLFPDEK